MPLFTEDELRINAPVSRVWNALIDPELTSRYMYGCRVECNWEVGAPIEWKGAEDGKLYVKGTLHVFDRGKKLSYTVFDPEGGYQDIPENYLTATYWLDEASGGTHLKVTQGDYALVAEGDKRYQDTINQGGWSTVLRKLRDVVENPQTGDQQIPMNDFSETNAQMIITTTDFIPNREISEILGIARGSTVRARNVGSDIFAGLKNLVGGEIDEYTRLQAESREQALKRMTDDAKKLEADAIINVRLTTSMVMQGAAEILAYGTAVKLS